jgi:methionyl-tRNA synthetase
MNQHDNRYYVTVPIYYVNGKPHIGTTYTTVIADIACRFARFMGRDALMVTGSDEYSQNIVDIAIEAGKSPREFCDEIIPSFHDAWKSVGIQSYGFHRTSDPAQHRLVHTFYQRIYNKGDIYKGEYSGWYHTSDNRFLDADEVPEKPEEHPRLKFLTEESYYFRLSAYQDFLLELHNKYPLFVVPDFRRNEMLSRIEAGLKDICISRTSTDWGVKLPWDAKHVFWVWMDALLTYVTGSGFDIDAYEETFAAHDPHSRSSEAGSDMMLATRRDLKTQPATNYWPCDMHIMAKDIPWFHAIIFPRCCKATAAAAQADSRAWLLELQRRENVKSLGNVVSPDAAMELVGVDGLRYFLAREVPLGLDGNFSHEGLVNRYNYDLANDLGNLASHGLDAAPALRGRGTRGAGGQRPR